MQGFIGAVPHILTEPAQALLVMALSLWLGQRPAGALKTYGFMAFPALVIGAVSALFLQGLFSVTSLLALAFAVVLGLSAAARLALPGPVVVLTTTAAALLAGRLAAPDPGPVSAVLASGTGALLGAAIMGALIFALTRWCVSPGRPALFGIAVRVAGSWIAAASLMAGALAFIRL
ncbi:hypothetical protein SAMN05880593_101571 [Rhizobium sp. RU36D]|nr:hypothetical protein SAMN05880593_101571 [Rhizobium sp. RU36D]